MSELERICKPPIAVRINSNDRTGMEGNGKRNQIIMMSMNQVILVRPMKIRVLVAAGIDKKTK